MAKEYGYICQYCNKKVNIKNICIDHIYPKYKGGKDNLYNYTIACSDCNIKKSYRNLIKEAKKPLFINAHIKAYPIFRKYKSIDKLSPNDIVICMVCGEEHRQLSIQHLRKHGYKTKEEYLLKYPNVKITGNATRRKQSIIKKLQINTNAEYKKKVINAIVDYWAKQDNRQKQSKRIKQFYKDHPDKLKEMKRRNRIICRTKSFRAKQKKLKKNYYEKLSQKEPKIEYYL